MKKIVKFFKRCVRKGLHILKKCKNGLVYATSLLFYLLPINKNKIVMDHFDGKGYGDSPKYLAEELLKDPKYKIIWMVNDKKTPMPNGIKKVKSHSLRALYHIITAKLWVGTVRGAIMPLFKRKKQFYLQTWHGGLPIKRIEKDAESELPISYIKEAKKDGEMCDCILSSSKFISDIFKRAFWTDAKILEYGIPRGDLLFDNKNESVLYLKKKYNLEGKFVVLYVPTFRSRPDFYETLDLDASKLKETFEKKYNKEVAICFKVHPNDLSKLDKMNMENIVNMSYEDDSQAVLMTADFLISDYSSMMFDFMFIQRPAIIYATDYEDYITNDRKLYVDVTKLGIPYYSSFDELIKGIENLDDKELIKSNKKAIEFFGITQQPNSTKIVVEYLKNEKII